MFRVLVVATLLASGPARGVAAPAPQAVPRRATAPATVKSRPPAAVKTPVFDAHTGRLVVPPVALLEAARHRDPAELARVGRRLGPAGLRAALRSGDAAVKVAALDALPSLPDAPLLLDDVVAALAEPGTEVAPRAARVLGRLLSGEAPDAFERLEVPAASVVAACAAMRARRADPGADPALVAALVEALAAAQAPEARAACAEPKPSVVKPRPDIAVAPGPR